MNRLQREGQKSLTKENYSEATNNIGHVKMPLSAATPCDDASTHLRLASLIRKLVSKIIFDLDLH